MRVHLSLLITLYIQEETFSLLYRPKLKKYRHIFHPFRPRIHFWGRFLHTRQHCCCRHHHRRHRHHHPHYWSYFLDHRTSFSYIFRYLLVENFYLH
ncbi:ORF913 [White spot syndrome virus]|uniref:ORF913 n=1 Tax=White spot syndrome virus TaxID=342409 RepID=A0A2D3I5L7_9VIRU|nr:ORF913 [White spot syndrome virus]